MEMINAFIACGLVCAAGQLLYDCTKWTQGHVVCFFVFLGAFMDLFGLYDMFLEFGMMGASLPITSFGHSLMHAVMEKTATDGLLGIASGMFDMVTPGITSAIFFAFIMALVFKPKW